MNQFMKIAISGALAALCTAATTATADEKVLKQCRAIKGELSRLQSLREDGGSAKKMDTWKRRMHDKQDEYSKLYCRQYRFELDKH